MAVDDALIKEKIIQRGELAKMTRQLKEKLFKAGLKVRDRSSQDETLLPSPTKVISDDIFNNISATAMQNIQNSKLATQTTTTPLRRKPSAEAITHTDMTPIISPMKRKNGAENEYDVSPSKKQMLLNSSPLMSNGSPYSNRVLLQTPKSIASVQQPQQPTTPPPRFSQLSGSKDQMTTANSENLLFTPKQKSKSAGSGSANKNDVGADLLLYLLKSPANNASGKTPSTPKLLPIANGSSSSGSASDALGMNLFGDHLNGTGVGQYSSSNFSPNLMASGQRCPQTPTANLMNTPINRFQTPLTPKRLKGTPGFSLMDFINFSPNCSRTPDLSNHEFSKLSNLNEENQQ